MGKALAYNKVIIFGGQIGEIDPKILNQISKDDFIICADKGYEFALKNKITPNLIVGDFDSAPFPNNAGCEIIKLPVKKDDTDLNFAVKVALERGFKSFILCGVTGGRLDQTAATIFTPCWTSITWSCPRMKTATTGSCGPMKRKWPCSATETLQSFGSAVC